MKIIGHRGAKGLAPENTLKSFEKALQHMVDEIELDVRLSKDRLPVLSHDPYLTDPAGNRLEIAASNFAELQLHKPDVTTLEEAVRQINRRVPIVVEIKPAIPIAPIVKLLGSFLREGWQNTDFQLASFDQKVLREAHARLPAIQTVVNESWSGVRASYRARQLGTKRVNMRSWWLWSGFLASVKRGGYQIAPYTMNDPTKVRRWQKYLYGVITDYPDRFEP